jgi:hypothetical protein
VQVEEHCESFDRIYGDELLGRVIGYAPNQVQPTEMWCTAIRRDPVTQLRGLQIG